MPGDLHQILKQYWDYDRFRPLQEELIRTVLEGKDALALMPTGGGKSLCYQLPTLAMDGLCLVVSPLIALMKDQVEGLRRKNITALSIYSGMSRKEVINTLRIAGESNCRFLYVSPERLESRLFLEYLPGLPVTLIAVDEAHCVSQWGYDFRPPYLRIAAIRKELPGIPMLALTASATPLVQQDICEKLELKGRQIFRQSFERPQLSYSCFKPASSINKIREILENVDGSAIIYCRSRKMTKEISEHLRAFGISSSFYHAGLDQETRNQQQADWLRGSIRVIVCTNAFGMGIDKADVRTVIHADVPECLENYYQEAGRAGRDGKRAYAVLLYKEKEGEELREMVERRFPSMDQIREVYQAVCNYLQVPSGTAQGEYFDFDLADLVQKFKLDKWEVLYSLKALEQDGWLAFNEQVFLPSSLVFTLDKQALYAFESSHPEWEPLIKTLLRSYEGIYDRMTNISERQLAGWLKAEPAQIKEQLVRLQAYGVLEYSPQKDKPQVVFLRERIPAAHLSLDRKLYEERKNIALQRAEKMISYIQDTDCRSVQIARYFGDEGVNACGICDNCLQRKKQPTGKEEFNDIMAHIRQFAAAGPADPTLLFSGMDEARKKKYWDILEFMQKENRISFDPQGRIALNASEQ